MMKLGRIATSFGNVFFAQSVWMQTHFWNGLQLPQQISFIDAMEATLKILNSLDFDSICIACWMIWNCRNKLFFESKTHPKIYGLGLKLTD